jgi:hypothetical protein
MSGYQDPFGQDTFRKGGLRRSSIGAPTPENPTPDDHDSFDFDKVTTGRGSGKSPKKSTNPSSREHTQQQSDDPTKENTDTAALRTKNSNNPGDSDGSDSDEEPREPRNRRNPPNPPSPPRRTFTMADTNNLGSSSRTTLPESLKLNGEDNYPAWSEAIMGVFKAYKLGKYVHEKAVAPKEVDEFDNDVTTQEIIE